MFVYKGDIYGEGMGEVVRFAGVSTIVEGGSVLVNARRKPSGGYYLGIRGGGILAVASARDAKLVDDSTKLAVPSYLGHEFSVENSGELGPRPASQADISQLGFRAALAGFTPRFPEPLDIVDAVRFLEGYMGDKSNESS